MGYPGDDRRERLGFIGILLLLAIAVAPAIYRLTAFGTAKGDHDVVLTYMAWGNPAQLEVEREIIRRFNQKMADEGRSVRVDLFMPPAGGYEQKLRLMLASGTAPDVIRADHYYFPSLVPKGYFRDLTDLWQNDPDFDIHAFHPAAMKENFYNGRLYGLNVLFGGVICFYNKDLFARAGLPDPYELWLEGKWTWEMFEHCARVLTTEDRSVYGFLMPAGQGGAPPAWAWAMWVWAHGGQVLSDDFSRCVLDSPEAIRALQQMKDLIYVHRLSPTTEDRAASAYTFASGNVAMEFNFVGHAAHNRAAIRDFRWDIVAIPYPADLAGEVVLTENGPLVYERGSDPPRLLPHTLVKGNQLVMSATCRHPQEAWEWMKFMTSYETELELHGDGRRRSVPTRIALLESGDYLDASRPPFNTRILPNLLDHANELPIDPTWPRWIIEVQPFMERLFVNPHTTAEEVMPQAAATITAVIARERQRLARYLEDDNQENDLGQ